MADQPQGDAQRRSSPGQLSDLIGSAMQHHNAGQLAAAEDAYRKLLAIHPDWAEVCYNLGNALKDQGKLDEAVAQYERAAALNPNLVQAHNNLGNILRDRGQLDQAATRYLQALARKPDYAEAHNNLGAVLKDQGKLDQAVARYEQALALKPDYAEAHNNLGVALSSQGKFEQAALRFEQAIALKPNYAEAYYNLANTLREQGKLDEAVARYEQSLMLKPDFAEAYNNMGAALKDLGKLDAAVAQYQQALARKPDYAEAYNNLGAVLKDQGKLDQAVANYEQALVFRPDHAETHVNLGVALNGQGKLDQAVASYQQALAVRSDYAETHYNLGNALRDQGKLAEALAQYEQALALKPDYAEAHYGRAEGKTFADDDADLAALEALAADTDCLPPGRMLYIHFALFKAWDDVGDYARAFEHLVKGNALKRQEVDYDADHTENTFRLLAELCDSALLNRLAGAGNPSPAPIFVLGMPRSGSTLVEQVLASHPQVHGAGELKHLDLLVRGGSGFAGRPIPFSQRMAALDAKGLRQLGQDYLARLPQVADDKQRITDKAPGNFFYVGLIRLMLPNARIVHTVRDPVDTCVSCFSRLFADLPFTYDLAELGRYYRGYHKLMTHWRSVLPAGAMLDIAYEDVVDDLEGQARRLIEYCGLPWDDRCLRFHETRRPITTASNVQVRQPLYRSSVARWRRYEAYLQPLLRELGDPRGGE